MLEQEELRGYGESLSNKVYNEINNTICKESGVYFLTLIPVNSFYTTYDRVGIRILEGESFAKIAKLERMRFSNNPQARGYTKDSKIKPSLISWAWFKRNLITHEIEDKPFLKSSNYTYRMED